jgi:hypothetical protein
MNNTPLLKRLFCAETVVFLGAWFLLMFFGRTQLFRDPGTFSHIVFGQHILSTHQLFHTDIYSFTFGGQPWIAQQWLGECIMAFLYKIGGFDGLLVVTVTLVAFLYAWLMNRLVNSGMHFSLALLIISLTFLASAHHYHIRPHIVTILFLASVFSRLCDYEAGRLRIGSLFWLVPLSILWTNIHGGVLGGLGTLGLVILGWSIDKVFFRRLPIRSYREMILLMGLLLACILSIFVNPYGRELPKTWFSIMSSPAIPLFIQEHASLVRTGSWHVLALAIFYIAALIGTFPKRPRITWLIPLVWLALTWSRIRNGPLFAVAAALALSEVFPHVRWAKWLSRKGSMIFHLEAVNPAGRRVSLCHLAVPSVILAATVVLNLASVRVPVIGHGWVKFDTTYWPVDLLPELRNIEKISSNGTPILNDYRLGGFIMFFVPRLRVFIDDRCELYGDQFLLDYVNAKSSMVKEWAEKYQFKIALTESSSYLDKYLKKDDGWEVVRRGASASLYRKSAKEIQDDRQSRGGSDSP